MSQSQKITRRRFISSAFAATSGLALTSFVAADSAYANGNSLIIDIDEYDELKEDGGFKVIKEVLIGDKTDSIIIVRKSETQYLVFSSVCRHKKCNVKYKKDRDLFVCPCHGSTYDLKGQVIKGPSEGNIAQYTVKLKNNKLEISI